MGPVPLDLDAVRAALRPHGKAVMLPAAAYTSDEVYAWERRHLFAAAWTCLGRAEELTVDAAGTPVTQRALDIGDVAAVLTRDGASLRAFANVCRHRGHELLPAGGTSTGRALVCGYHGWAYRLDGRLHAAPGLPRPAGEPDGAANGRFALAELPLCTWHGWVFVNATGDAPPLPRYLGAVADLVAPYRPGDLVRRAGHRYDVAANWKVIVENYHECYHCPQIHPELCRVSPPASGDNWHLPGAWVGGRMDLAEHAETMSLDGRSGGVALPGVDARTVAYLGVFPNLLLSAHPDYVMAHRLEPLSATRTRVECAWYFPPQVSDPEYAVRFWDLTNRQDWAACESVQRGLANPHFRPGPLLEREDAVYRFVGMVARSYLDPAAGLAAMVGGTPGPAARPDPDATGCAGDAGCGGDAG